MFITKDSVVTATYELREDSATGEVIEIADAAHPFVFLFGHGQLLPDFEKNLKGLKEQDTFSFHIPADRAYGVADPEAVVELPTDLFLDPESNKLDPQVVVGATLRLENEHGELLEGVVMDIADDMVVMDFNHPMAGINLHFTGTVLNIRMATASELAHGHVHGPGGHHHHDH
jgi:FKBP-type peptidyl-prolyl cis-trans isomerase SlyD